MTPDLEFKAYIKRKIFWRKRLVTIIKNNLSYQQQDQKQTRSFDLNSYNISILTCSQKDSQKTEFIISFANEVQNIDLKLKIDDYELFSSLMDHFQKNSLKIASQRKHSSYDSEIDSSEILTPRLSDARNLKDHFETNDLKVNKDQIGAKINKIKEQIHERKILFYGDKNETIHVIQNNAIFNVFIQQMAQISVVFQFLLNFIYQYNTLIKFICAILVINSFSILCQKFVYIVPIVIIGAYILNQTKAKIKIYIKKPQQYTGDNDYYQEFIQITQDVIQSKIGQIFNEKIRDTTIQIKHTYQQNSLKPTEELYFLLIQNTNIDSYLKIKSGIQSFHIEYYGQFRLQIRQILQILKYKIENKLQNFSINCKNMDVQQNLLIQSRENMQIDRTQKKSIFSVNVETLKNPNNQTQKNKRFSVDNIQIFDENPIDNQTNDNISMDSLNFQTVPSHYNLEQKIKFYSSLNYINFVFSEVYKSYQKDMQLNWDIIEEKEQIYSIYKLDNNEYLMRKTVQNIKCSVSFFKEILFKPNLLNKYNKLVKFANIEQKYNENTFLQRLAVKCPFPITDRDYLDYVVFKKTGDKKSILLMTRAPDELFQPQRGYVRAENAYATHEIEEIEPDLLKVTSCTKSNAKMQMIPKSVIEMGAKNVGQIPLQMKKYIEEEYQKYKQIVIENFINSI